MPKPDDAYKVVRGSAAWYPAVTNDLAPQDPLRWAITSDLRIALLLYSDGTTRVEKRIVRQFLRIRARPELLVLVCYPYLKLKPYYVAVSGADWWIWQQYVLAIDDPSQLPALPRQRRSRSQGSLE